MSRYKSNIGTISKEENEILNHSKVCVIGCGGLGGYIIEMLGRIGVGNITAVDFDRFEESNLNRQLLSDEFSLGEKKSLMAKLRMEKVNPQVQVNSVIRYVDKSNAEEILSGHDLVVDGLDNIPSRLVLEETCEKLKIPLVHGAIASWYGQVSSVFPGDKTLSKVYSKSESKGVEQELGIPSFTPALVASIQVSQVIKILIGRGDVLQNKLLFMDLLNDDYVILDI